MRIATLIISLCLTLALGIQSCAVYAASSMVGGLSEEGSKDQADSENTASGGATGLLVSLLWIVGAAFVLAKPKVSMWVFGVAAVFAVIGGTTGFTDLYYYAGVSVLFALASWRGITEKRKQDERERAAYQADIQAAARAVAAG